ncbi:TPA: hypothetical protein ACX4DQ_002272 [Enterococcus faecalis]|uniref:hypothetical protein n=1 Tax=Enterococcus faecalis TaxID=1351 RepID=UPI001EE3C49B|nr:hypothetical protein [Enterococcus faecalis]EHB5081917.1 hypothetical protein [Enterococcus faecalis]EKK5287619.1 hypothetical protein [Enterococcus faecalis]MDK7897385.1 hypothetical protein [Enterococcus faecalis]UKU96305.1 hypothetical protein L5I25_09720 [Enterococcus faecalis]UKU99000.1 hypothetical protein L5I23_09800 [Enterococcus faecalis]
MQKIENELNGYIIFEKEGQNLKIHLGNLDFFDAMSLGIMGSISIAMKSGVSLEKFHEILNEFEQYLLVVEGQEE